MTDNEIITALECCANSCDNGFAKCGECPRFAESEGCTLRTMKDALDLINRQKAEIERLQKVNDSLGEAGGKLVVAYKKAKSEAIKEFVKEVINNILPKYLYGHEETALRIGFALSEKAKEMTEQKG